VDQGDTQIDAKQSRHASRAGSRVQGARVFFILVIGTLFVPSVAFAATEYSDLTIEKLAQSPDNSGIFS